MVPSTTSAAATHASHDRAVRLASSMTATTHIRDLLAVGELDTEPQHRLVGTRTTWPVIDPVQGGLKILGVRPGNDPNIELKTGRVRCAAT
jgi:hypothetical protein